MFKALVISLFGAILVAFLFLLYVMGLIHAHRIAERKKEEKLKIQEERKAKLQELIAQKEEKEQRKVEAIENAKKHVSGKATGEKETLEAGVDLSMPAEPQVSDQPKVSLDSVEVNMEPDTSA